MDFHLPTHGISWNSIFWRFVKFHGYPCPYCWNSMELQLLMIREIPWNSRQGKLKTHGTPAFHDLWNSMEFQTRINGIPWNSRFYQSVEIHGFSHGLSGIPWIFSLTKVPRETHDTPINPRMTPAFSNSNFIYVFVIACHYSSNNHGLKILPWA